MSRPADNRTPQMLSVADALTKRPAGSVVFGLLCLVLIVSTLLFGSTDQASWMVLSLLCGGIAIAWLGGALYRGTFIVNLDMLLLPVIGMIVIGVAQIIPLFPSQLPAAAIQNPTLSTISLDPYATRLFVARTIVYLVFFAAALTFLSEKTRLKRMVALIAGFGSVMAIFAILQRLISPESIYGMRVSAQAIPFGTMINQHHFASFMVMTAGMTFAMLISRSLGRDKSIFLIFGTILMCVAIVMTGSRGGLISLLGTLLFAVVATRYTRAGDFDLSGKTKGSQKLAIAAGVLASLFIVFGIVVFLGADSSLIRSLGLAGGDVSNGRSHFWAIAVKVFAAHPFLGAGLDAFGVAFTRYDTWPGEFRVEQAHNDYLQTLADAGIAGFVCISAYIVLLFKKGLSTVMATADTFKRAATIGALASCFGVLIHSFFDFPLRTPSNGFFFLTLSAIAVVEIQSKRRHRTLTKSSR